MGPGWHTGDTVPMPLRRAWGTISRPQQCVWGTDSGPLQCAWGARYGPCGMSGAPTMRLYSVSGGPIGAPTGWIRDAGLGSLGVKGPFACQSHGPSGPRDL